MSFTACHKCTACGAVHGMWHAYRLHRCLGSLPCSIELCTAGSLSLQASSGPIPGWRGTCCCVFASARRYHVSADTGKVQVMHTCMGLPAGHESQIATRISEVHRHLIP